MINAASTVRRDPIPAGNYIARCYSMIHVGTIEDSYMGETKFLNKVRIGWELPTELRVFNEDKGEQPLVISKEYTLSLGEKANLRKALASWRGKDFSEQEAKSFDITKLLGQACMLNIIHRTAKNGNIYADIGSISPLPKGMSCPKQVNGFQLWQYDEPNMELLESLPDFIKNKIKSSSEYAKLSHPNATHLNGNTATEDDENDLTF